MFQKKTPKVTKNQNNTSQIYQILLIPIFFKMRFSGKQPNNLNRKTCKTVYTYLIYQLYSKNIYLERWLQR